MSFPVELSDLPVATTAAPNDLMLLRKGLTDYQAAVSVIQAINIDVLSPVPAGSANATDKLLISRNAKNYNIRFDQVGLMKNTKCWFYQAVAPLGWKIVGGTGDRVLSVATPVVGATPAVPYSGVSAGNPGGTWQQDGTALTIAQMPKHTHGMHCSDDNLSGKGSNYYRSGKTDVSHDKGVYQGTSTGSGQAHNHGKTWRPLANVGIICNKQG